MFNVVNVLLQKNKYAANPHKD